MRRMKQSKSTKPILFFLLAGLMIALAIGSVILSESSNFDSSKIDTEDLTNESFHIEKLIINEICTTSSGVISDYQGNSHDYIELYNGTDSEIVLDNYGLSDSEKEIKWVFPANSSIGPHEYLTVFCSGQAQEGMFANFKISSSGNEVISLRKPSGKVIDAVETVALEANQVMGRNADGKWVIQNLPTPGFANTIEGHDTLLASIQTVDDSSLIINEFLVRNDGNFMMDHQFYGFIEIKNISDSIISLNNYSLSNSLSESFKWQFPNVMIQPNEVLVVYTSGKNLKNDVLHSSFKLEGNTGDVVLTNNKGQVIASYSYENVSDGVSMVYAEGGYFESCEPTPGYENSAEGIKAFHSTFALENDLIISEAMSNNYSYLAQNGANYYDWIEIYNNSDHAILLSDYYLSDSLNQVNKYQLPEVTLEANAYYVIMASGNTDLTNKSYYHANFGLAGREGIYLSKNNKVVDSLFVGDLPSGYSYGKDASGMYYYKTPTPKAKNDAGTIARSSSPSSSQGSLVVNGVDEVVVALNGVGTIYYTTNGSNPTTSSKVYSEPLHLTKTTVLKFMAKEQDKMVSQTLTCSYIINENHTLPVLSLSMDQSKINNLHSHAWTEGYEVGGGVIELLEDNESKFSIPFGLQMFGGSARGYPKKCYEVVFKKKYGAGHLEYPLFEKRDTSFYQSFVLRTGSQDEEESVIRDLVGTSLVDDYTDVDVQAYKSVILYMNGKYWGIYFIREKVDEHFVANHYNVEATTTNTDIVRIDRTYKSGNMKAYNNLRSFVSSHDMSKKANYDKVKDMINVENCADYWIAVIYTTNNDIVNSRMFRNPNLDDGRFHYIFYDLDFAFYNYSYNFFNFTTDPGGMTFNHWETTILRNLMKNAEFRQMFLERLSYNMKNTWKKDIVLQRLDDIYNEIKPEMKRDRARWGHSYAYWEDAVSGLRNYIKKRDSYIKKHAKSYFGLSNAEYEKYFGG